MAEGSFDRNLKRLLDAAQQPEEASPQFRETLRQRLQAEAAQLRRSPVGADPAPTFERAVRRSPWMIAAAAMLLVVVGGLGWRAVRGYVNPRVVDRLENLEPVFPAVADAPPQPLHLSADRAVVMEIARGSTGSVAVERGGAELALLDLRDGAEVELRPGPVPVLALRAGVLRVRTAAADIRVEAAHVGLDVRGGTHFEIAFIDQGDRHMIRSWLIPGGLGAAAGAAVVAILVHYGDVEVKAPETRPAAIPVERPLVIEVPTTRPVPADDRDGRLAHAERRIADLEKKLLAAKKENDKLASDLVQKKGVTLDSIAARLADLRKGTGMNVFLPGKTAELIADLKGLGAAGTQALLDMLKSEDAKDRFIAAKLLEDLKDPAAIPALRDVALNDPDKDAANMAGHALALMDDPRTIETLREMVARKRSWESEVNALWGLVNLGDRQGLEQATAYMLDEKVSKQARAALGANIAVFMHTPEVMPIVDQTVRDFSESGPVMAICIEYYKAIGSPVARGRLQAIADDTRQTEEVRNQAREALLH